MFAGNVMTESLALVDALHPISKTAAAYNGTAVDMSLYHRIMYILDVGVLQAGSTIDFKLQGSVDSAYTTPKDIAGKAITQILAGGGNNVICKVGMTAEDLLNLVTTQPGCRYVRYVLTVGTAASVVGVLALAGVGRFKPESGNDIAAVAQTISDAS